MKRIILCGHFCTGKTTILKYLWEKHRIPKIIDDTTRPMRKNETQGFPYNFISTEEFQKRIDEGYYFEHVKFNGYNYGVPKNALLEQKDWCLDVLASSWPHYQHIPGVIGIYLEPPPIEVLIERARLRGDTEDHIQQRLELHQDEELVKLPIQIPSYITLEKTIEEVEKHINKK